MHGQQNIKILNIIGLRIRGPFPYLRASVICTGFSLIVGTEWSFSNVDVGTR